MEEMEAEETVKSVDEALKAMADGNWRYTSDMPMGLNRTTVRRQEVASVQRPFAAVVGCSDSRVPPELIFDVGLGDIFVVRSAGQVIDEAALGSLEYAAGHLGVQLVMVLGHTDCGAVKAAMARTGAAGHLSWVLNAIDPVVVNAPAGAGGQLGYITKAHIERTVRKIQQAGPVLSALAEAGKLRVVGALYDVQSGKVTFFPEAGRGMETF